MLNRLSRSTRVRAFNFVMDQVERYPRAVRFIGRRFANLPILAPRLGVLTRAVLGATAFEIHDVDYAQGTIGIGGVEEVIFGRKIIHAMHTVLGARMGEEAKNQALFDIALEICQWEAQTAIDGGRWAPRALVPLIMNGSILDEIERDPEMARFFERVLNIMSRLITDEGGWGHLEFEVRGNGRPIRVRLRNSQEARWLAPAEAPVCHLYRGIIAGYSRILIGKSVEVEETRCMAMDGDECVFTVKPLSR